FCGCGGLKKGRLQKGFRRQMSEVAIFFNMIFAGFETFFAKCFAKEHRAGESKGYQMFTIGSPFVKRNINMKTFASGRYPVISTQFRQIFYQKPDN
ncbi:MAG: hypothetical protein KA165_21030, partial [Saprospiraceae bacterium]|nr:hypothetical protein [Saprospiraceae bacterium]